MAEIIILFLFIFIIFLFLIIFSVFGLYIFDIFLPVPFVASKREQVLKMIKIAEIKTGDRVLDLGSGDGRLVIEAAKAGADAVGVEKNPFLVLLSKIFAKIAGVKVKVVLGDIFSQDLSAADIIFLYLNSKTLKKLAGKIKRETKKGAKIVSNSYEIPNFKSTKNFDKIFLYEI